MTTDRDLAALGRLARSYGLRARLGPGRAIPATLLRLEAQGLAERSDPWGKLWTATGQGRAIGLLQHARPVAPEPQEEIDLTDDE